jgi:DUF438 domain-containing protein
MFITDWILLKKLFIKDNKNLYHIFSKDYGRINSWCKEQKNWHHADIWCIVNCAIDTNQNINKIRSYKVKKVLDYTNLNYKSIENILHLINLILKITPEWVSNSNILKDYDSSLEYFEDNTKNEKCTELFKLKLVKYSWFWSNLNNFDATKNLKRLYSVIDKYDIKTVYTIKWVEPDLIDELRRYNNESIRNYLS